MCHYSGRGGSTIRSLSEDSGAKISMTSKDEAIFTQERILSIAGGKSACVKCLSMVISKLAEDSEVNQFTNKGTNYMTSINAFDYTRGGGGRRGTSSRGRGRGDSRGRGRGGGGGGGGAGEDAGGYDASAFDDISASTTISMAVPELLIGNILGKNVSHLLCSTLLYFTLFCTLTHGPRHSTHI